MTRTATRVSFLAIALCAALAGCSTLTPGINNEKISAPIPYVTTPYPAVTAMLKLAGVTSGDTVYDLGSGDGRIVIAAARDFGAHAVGVEMDPALIRESERNAQEAGVESRVRFVKDDLFLVDFRDATVVTLFLLPGVNAMLLPKLLKDLKPGTRVVSYLHDMGEWEPDRTVRIETGPIYYWVIPADVGGMWALQISGPKSLLTLSFRQSFQKVSGGVRLHGKTLELSDARIEGKRLSFVGSGTADGQRVRMEFSGSVENEHASGSVLIKEGLSAGSYEWTALRSHK